MSHQVCIFEDKKFSNFFPLSLSQPVFDLRVGFQTLRKRLQDEFADSEFHVICRDYLAEITRIKTPNVKVNDEPEADTLFVNGRLLCMGEELKTILEQLPLNTIAVKGGYVVGANLPVETARAFWGYIRKRTSEETITHLCNVLRGLADYGPPEQPRSAKAPRKIREQDAAEGTYEDIHAVGQDNLQEKLPVELTELIDEHRIQRVDMEGARLLSFPWQLIEFNGDVITDDFMKLPFRGESEESITYPGVYIINEESIVVGEGAVIKSGTVLDASDGPIAIGDRAVINPNTTIVGPVSIGADSVVKAGSKILEGTSVGTVCKVGGEIEGTIISSYSNKQHDGFIGHSYIGEWVNIGAASNNSDLKNNYSSVRMWCAGSMKHTGRQFLGVIIGDHTKTGINTLFNTGTVVGFNCNIFSSEMPDKFVPSYSWGHGMEMTEYDLAKAMQTAEIVLERRRTRFCDAHRSVFNKIAEMSRLCHRNI